MTEANERIASLETNMGYVLGVLAKREEYQTSVLKSLTTIEIKQDQSLLYQKTCDAERTAHAARLGTVENALAAMEKTTKALDGVSSRLGDVEKHVARGNTIWWFVFRASGSASGFVALAASLAGLWRHG